MSDKRTYADRREYLKEFSKTPEQRKKTSERRKKRLDEDPALRAAKNEYQRNWRAANPKKVAEASARHKAKHLEKRRQGYRDAGFKKRYGITEAQRDEMLAAQDGVCAICGSNDPASKKGWHVDHSHATGKIRAILCANCNVALGHANDDVNRLKAMVLYLEKHSGLD